MYNKLTLEQLRYVVARGERNVFVAMFPEDCEDLVALYLQEHPILLPARLRHLLLLCADQPEELTHCS